MFIKMKAPKGAERISHQDSVYDVDDTGHVNVFHEHVKAIEGAGYTQVGVADELTPEQRQAADEAAAAEQKAKEAAEAAQKAADEEAAKRANARDVGNKQKGR